MRSSRRRVRHGGWVAAIALLAVLASGEAGAELWGPRSKVLFDGVGSEFGGQAFDQDQLGNALAAGDFNGDGRDDLAIADFESSAGTKEGLVVVRYSDPSGGLLFVQRWRDFLPWNGDVDVEPGDEFGAALAAGDFDGDGIDDLAIGIPGDDIAGAFMGQMLVLYGQLGSGLSSLGSPPGERFHSPFFGTSGATGDRFAESLAAGDFDGDGVDDLAIGVPLADIAGIDDAGKVIIAYGRAELGLGFPNTRTFSQNSSDDDGEMQDAAEIGDRFGSALATGDFNFDGRDDLAIGVPGESISGFFNAGLVQILYGFSPPGTKGLRHTNNQAWSENNIDTEGTPQNNKFFGTALAAGDLTGEGVGDLAIGAPGEIVGGFLSSGAVTLLRGLEGIGIHPAGSERFDQTDLEGSELHDFEKFGSSLAIGDFVETSFLGANDLAVGAVGEWVLHPELGVDQAEVGAVTILPGGITLSPGSAVRWTPGVRGSAGVAALQVGLRYARALAGGDFDGNGDHDLAIGAIGGDGLFEPGEPAVDSGAVQILFGALFADGFESGDTGGWDAAE